MHATSASSSSNAGATPPQGVKRFDSVLDEWSRSFGGVDSTVIDYLASCCPTDEAYISLYEETIQSLVSVLAKSDYAMAMHFSNEYLLACASAMLDAALAERRPKQCPSGGAGAGTENEDAHPDVSVCARFRAWFADEKAMIIATSLYWLGSLATAAAYFYMFRTSPLFDVLGYWICAAKACVGVIYFNCVVVFLPVCNGLVTLLQARRTTRAAIPVARLFAFHKIAAYSIMIAGLGHTIAHLAGTFTILQNTPCPSSFVPAASAPEPLTPTLIAGSRGPQPTPAPEFASVIGGAEGVSVSPFILPPPPPPLPPPGAPPPAGPPPPLRPFGLAQGHAHATMSMPGSGFGAGLAPQGRVQQAMQCMGGVCPRGHPTMHALAHSGHMYSPLQLSGLQDSNIAPGFVHSLEGGHSLAATPNSFGDAPGLTMRAAIQPAPRASPRLPPSSVERGNGHLGAAERGALHGEPGQLLFNTVPFSPEGTTPEVVTTASAPAADPPFCGLSYWELIFRSMPGVTGVLLWLCFTLMFCTSLEWVRAKHFNTFFIVHQLFIGAVILLCLHGTGGWVQAPHAWRYLLCSVAVYAVDRVVRLVQAKISRPVVLRRARVIDIPLPPRTPAPGTAAAEPSRTDAVPSGSVSPALESFIVLELVRPRAPTFTFKAGQYVQVQVPSLSAAWHPFTISSSPLDQKSITLTIKVAGRWTTALRALIRDRVGLAKAGSRGSIVVPMGLNATAGSVGAETGDDESAAIAVPAEAGVSAAAGAGAGAGAGVLQTGLSPFAARATKWVSMEDVNVAVNGPLGAPTTEIQSVLRGHPGPEACLMVAGGIGVTPFVSVMEAFGQMLRVLPTPLADPIVATQPHAAATSVEAQRGAAHSATLLGRLGAMPQPPPHLPARSSFLQNQHNRRAVGDSDDEETAAGRSVSSKAGYDPNCDVDGDCGYDAFTGRHGGDSPSLSPGAAAGPERPSASFGAAGSESGGVSASAEHEVSITRLDSAARDCVDVLRQAAQRPIRAAAATAAKHDFGRGSEGHSGLRLEEETDGLAPLRDSAAISALRAQTPANTRSFPSSASGLLLAQGASSNTLPSLSPLGAAPALGSGRADAGIAHLPGAPAPAPAVMVPSSHSGTHTLTLTVPSGGTGIITGAGVRDDAGLHLESPGDEHYKPLSGARTPSRGSVRSTLAALRAHMPGEGQGGIYVAPSASASALSATVKPAANAAEAESEQKNSDIPCTNSRPADKPLQPQHPQQQPLQLARGCTPAEKVKPSPRGGSGAAVCGCTSARDDMGCCPHFCERPSASAARLRGALAPTIPAAAAAAAATSGTGQLEDAGKSPSAVTHDDDWPAAHSHAAHSHAAHSQAALSHGLHPHGCGVSGAGSPPSRRPTSSFAVPAVQPGRRGSQSAAPHSNPHMGAGTDGTGAGVAPLMALVAHALAGANNAAGARVGGARLGGGTWGWDSSAGSSAGSLAARSVVSLTDARAAFDSAVAAYAQSPDPTVRSALQFALQLLMGVLTRPTPFPQVAPFARVSADIPLHLVWAVRSLRHAALFHSTLNKLVLASDLSIHAQDTLDGLGTGQRGSGYGHGQREGAGELLCAEAALVAPFITRVAVGITLCVTCPALRALARDPLPWLRAQREQQQLHALRAQQTRAAAVGAAAGSSAAGPGAGLDARSARRLSLTTPVAAPQSTKNHCPSPYLYEPVNRAPWLADPAAGLSGAAAAAATAAAAGDSGSGWLYPRDAHPAFPYSDPASCLLLHGQLLVSTHARGAALARLAAQGGSWLLHFERPGQALLKDMMLRLQDKKLESATATAEATSEATAAVGAVQGRQSTSLGAYCCCPEALSSTVKASAREAMGERAGNLFVRVVKELF